MTGRVMTEGSTPSHFFVLQSEFITLAISYTIKQGHFIVRSFIRNKTFRKCTHKYHKNKFLQSHVYETLSKVGDLGFHL
jgi:hypothetical protein